MGGRDQDLFAVVTTTPEGFPNQVLHHVVTARPVPAGEYRFNIHVLRPDELICGGWSEFVKNSGGTYLTVTAPAGTLHEAFFDPVDIGTAVGADSSDGVLKPAAFTVGGANTTISSLKWESGTATMTLDPSTSLAGHAVDFIALDGSVSLALSFDDATQGGGGALTWSVASQPWNAGDLLMLRIRSTANDHHAAHGHADTHANGGAHRYSDRHTDPGGDTHAYTDTHGDAYAHADPDAYINAHTYDDRASHRDTHTTCRRPHLLRHRHPMEPLRFVRKLLRRHHHRRRLSDISPWASTHRKRPPTMWREAGSTTTSPISG